MPKLFGMSDRDIDMAAERYYDRLLDEWERNQRDFCCGECRNFLKTASQCCRYDTESDEEYYVDVDSDDDACDNFEYNEDLDLPPDTFDPDEYIPWKERR